MSATRTHDFTTDSPRVGMGANARYPFGARCGWRIPALRVMALMGMTWGGPAGEFCGRRRLGIRLFVRGLASDGTGQGRR